MGKLTCICGNRLSNSSSPNKTVGYIVTDMELSAFGGDEIRSLDIMDSRSVWECDQCGRLAVDFPSKGDSTVKWYKPEDDKPGNLMRNND